MLALGNTGRAITGVLLVSAVKRSGRMTQASFGLKYEPESLLTVIEVDGRHFIDLRLSLTLPSIGFYCLFSPHLVGREYRRTAICASIR